jgi:hypothetical protein
MCVCACPSATRTSIPSPEAGASFTGFCRRTYGESRDILLSRPREILREVPSGAAQRDEGRKRVIGIMAAILASLHMQTADDLFGTPQGSPRTDKLLLLQSSGLC